MLIGIITPEYPPYAAGGIGTATVSFVRNMALAGHSIDVFAIFQPDVEGYDPDHDRTISEDENIRVHYFSYQLTNSGHSDEDKKILNKLKSKNILLAKSWVVAKKLGSFIQKKSLDVIFCADYMGLGTYFLLEQKAKPLNKRIPFIMTIHTGHKELNYANYLSTNNRKNWEKDIIEMEELSFDLATHLHSPSHFLADFVKNTYAIAREIEIIPYFPPFLESTSNQGYRRNEDNSKRVLYIGRLERRKGFKEFLLAAQQLLRNGKGQYEFIIAGGEWYDEFANKDYSTEVKKFIPNEHTKHISFLGSIPHDELPTLIKSADIMVVPSLFENYPNTCMEAAQLGIPVLISESGGMAEIVGDEEITKLVPLDVNDIAGKIAFFLSLPLKDRNKIAEKQNSFFQKKHQPESLIRQYETLIDKAVKAHMKDEVYFTSGEKTIGVGIPVFNTGKYLDDCLNSIMKQKRKPDKVVVINDGSNDKETLEKLDKWRAHFTVINQTNKGLCSTRNELIRTLKSEDYLLLLDSDDKLHPDYLLKAEKYLENNDDVGAVVSYVQTFGAISEIYVPLPFRFPEALIQNRITSSVALIRSSSIPSHLSFDDKLSPFTAEDWDFWIGYHECGNKIAVLPELLFQYRVRHDSKWHTLNYRKYMYIMEHLMTQHRRIYQEYSDAVMLELFSKTYHRTFQEDPGIIARIVGLIPPWVRSILNRSRLFRRIASRILANIQ